MIHMWPIYYELTTVIEYFIEEKCENCLIQRKLYSNTTGNFSNLKKILHFGAHLIKYNRVKSIRMV